MFGPHPRPVVEATARSRSGRVDAVPDVRLHLHRTAGAVDLLVSSAGEAGARRVHHVVRRRLVHGGSDWARTGVVRPYTGSGGGCRYLESGVYFRGLLRCVAGFSLEKRKTGRRKGVK